MSTQETTPAHVVSVTIVRDRHGDEHCHATGCRDLKPSKYLMGDAFTLDVTGRDDVTYEVWGAGGIASDNYEGDIYDEGYRAYTLANYDGLIQFFPCATKLFR